MTERDAAMAAFLQDCRLAVADQTYETMDLKRFVETAGPWTVEGDVWRRRVGTVTATDHNSLPATISIEFAAGGTDIVNIAAVADDRSCLLAPMAAPTL